MRCSRALMSLISHLIAVKTGRGEIADERIMKKQHFAETGKPVTCP